MLSDNLSKANRTNCPACRFGARLTKLRMRSLVKSGVRYGSRSNEGDRLSNDRLSATAISIRIGQNGATGAAQARKRSGASMRRRRG